MAEEPIEDLLIAEFVNGNARDRGARGEALRIGRRFIENYLWDVRRSDDPDAILHTDGAIIGNDLQRYVNSRAMRTSLEASLAEHAVATGLLETVRDPKEYRRVDAAHRPPRNRIGAFRATRRGNFSVRTLRGFSTWTRAVLTSRRNEFSTNAG